MLNLGHVLILYFFILCRLRYLSFCYMKSHTVVIRWMRFSLYSMKINIEVLRMKEMFDPYTLRENPQKFIELMEKYNIQPRDLG